MLGEEQRSLSAEDGRLASIESSKPCEIVGEEKEAAMGARLIGKELQRPRRRPGVLDDPCQCSCRHLIRGERGVAADDHVTLGGPRH